MAEFSKLLLLAEDASAPLAERIAAAHEVAAAGDPRLAEARVPIDGGIFPMGIPPRAVEARPFRMDMFPVTVGAFARFIEAGGYAERAHWNDEGWAWKVDENIRCPRFWGDTDWQVYLVDNHPIVGVSFHEACAYASFSGARLPTEAEWERAAAGVEGRAYPWGPTWIDGACAMRGVGPRSTVPIGVFPLNRTPEGVRDLVGCVWQWCTDPFGGWGADAPETDAFGAEPRRVVRGGAWNSLQWSITCQSRNGYPLTARFSNLGFRCVVDRGSERDE